MHDQFRRLATLLREGRPAETVVAFGAEGERTWSQFESQVSSLVVDIAKASPGPWLLYTEDSYACAVALLALSQAGSSAVLAANHQPGTLRRIKGQVVGALLDPGIKVGELAGLPQLNPLAARSSTAVSFEVLSPDAQFTEFSTSGTTGERKSVPKALRHLDDEVAFLESHFGPRLAGETRVFSTASHQHIYGMLFRVLWPLAAGRPFCAETFRHPEELLPRMAEADSALLVSTPAHLNRLASMRGSLVRDTGCQAIFSSGGPLDDETARGIAARMGSAPLEIFGSTETGGVAWRQQSESSRWQLFEAVEVEREEDGRLRVRSPFVSVGRGSAKSAIKEFVMGDRVALLPGGSFRLLGRVDRMVKVGEKRLSLPEMETRLCTHEYVAATALVSLEQRREARVHAVVVLTKAGWSALQERGRRAMARRLSIHLESEWDRVLLPRAWRYVRELPRDTQGKTSQSALLSLFSEPILDPVLLSETKSERRLERTLRVPADLSYFEGHFESFPIVAGVVQLRWVFAALRDWLGYEAVMQEIEALKFQRVLGPDQRFEMHIDASENWERVSFQLRDGDRLFSSGRCLLKLPKASE